MAKRLFLFKLVEVCGQNAITELDHEISLQNTGLSTCDWIRHAHSVLIAGATGCGKTWLACALWQQACRQGFSVLYVRIPRLFEELRFAHGDGSFTRKLAALARTDVLLLDDWGVNPLTQPERADLLEILDDRVATRSTINYNSRSSTGMSIWPIRPWPTLSWIGSCIKVIN